MSLRQHLVAILGSPLNSIQPRSTRNSVYQLPQQQLRLRPSPHIIHLKLHGVWALSVSQAEVGGEVTCKQILLLDCGEDWLVDGFLVRCTGGGGFLGLLGQLDGAKQQKLVWHTSGFSPCLKKASSPFSLFDFFSRTKYSGFETLSSAELSTSLRSTLVDVAMTYRAFTLLSGTPLILNGPVTRRVPWSSCLRRTTRLPRNRPARRMRMAPGWRVSLYLVGLIDFRVCCSLSVGCSVRDQVPQRAHRWDSKHSRTFFCCFSSYAG